MGGREFVDEFGHGDLASRYDECGGEVRSRKLKLGPNRYLPIYSRPVCTCRLSPRDDSYER